MKNSLKAQVKQELLKKYAPDVVARALAKAQRMLIALYGNGGIEGWNERLKEDGDMEGLISFVIYYCVESLEKAKPGDCTTNRELISGGIYKGKR